MRPIWKGALSFGLVNIPVQLYSAIQAGERVSFRLLHQSDNSPIRYERVCQKDGKTVPWDDIVKGYEYAKGRFVVMTDEDFKAAALESSKLIEIEAAKLQLEKARRDYERSKQLFADKLISQELFEDTRTQYELARNALDTGNPVYPLAYRVFGGRHWDAELDARWSKAAVCERASRPPSRK